MLRTSPFVGCKTSVIYTISLNYIVWGGGQEDLFCSIPMHVLSPPPSLPRSSLAFSQNSSWTAPMGSSSKVSVVMRLSHLSMAPASRDSVSSSVLISLESVFA